MFESSPWSALLVVLLATPAWAQAPGAAEPPRPPAAPAAQVPPPPPALIGPAGDALPRPEHGQPEQPSPQPADPATGLAPPPGGEPFVVQNPYPPAPIVAGRLPPPRQYAVEPKVRRPRHYGKGGAPFALGIGANIVFRDDVGYRRLGAERRQAEIDLHATYDLVQVGSKLVIGAGLGYRRGQRGDQDQLLLISHAVSLELMARYKACGWLAPHVRAGVGLLTSRVELHHDVDTRLEDRENGVLGTLGAGFTLRTPGRLFETYAGRLSSLSLGILVEGGYVLAKAASYRPRPQGDGEIPQQSVALGSLSQAGPFVRVAAVIRF